MDITTTCIFFDYAISYKNNEKTQLSVESSNPNFQNFEVRMGDDV